jgi:trehalose 6-phosphate phosphatase
MVETHDLPAPPPLDALVVNGGLALFLDFDGTLVDLAASPDTISVPHDLAERLLAMAGRLEGRLALVTGRALDDLGRHLPLAGIACAGSHGADCIDAAGSALGDPVERMPQPAVEALEAAAHEHGLAFERKAHGAALHYRENPGREAAAIAIAADVASRYGLTVLEGKCVVELVRGEADKGSAVATFVELAAFEGATPVFVGDDLTDEHGFRASHARGGFGVIVGDRTPTSARYRLPDVSSVYDWLGL